MANERGARVAMSLFRVGGGDLQGMPPLYLQLELKDFSPSSPVSPYEVFPFLSTRRVSQDI